MKDQLGTFLATRLFGDSIFVVGSGRSGTRVLLQSLGLHPNIDTEPSNEAQLLSQLAGVASYLKSHDNPPYIQRTLKSPKDSVHKAFCRICFESIAGLNFVLMTLLKNSIKRDRAMFRKQYWSIKMFASMCDTKWQRKCSELHVVPSCPGRPTIDVRE